MKRRRHRHQFVIAESAAVRPVARTSANQPGFTGAARFRTPINSVPLLNIRIAVGHREEPIGSRLRLLSPLAAKPTEDRMTVLSAMESGQLQ